jgi:hypothetical protein
MLPFVSILFTYIKAWEVAQAWAEFPSLPERQGVLEAKELLLALEKLVEALVGRQE